MKIHYIILDYSGWILVYRLVFSKFCGHKMNMEIFRFALTGTKWSITINKSAHYWIVFNRNHNKELFLPFVRVRGPDCGLLAVVQCSVERLSRSPGIKVALFVSV